MDNKSKKTKSEKISMIVESTGKVFFGATVDPEPYSPRDFSLEPFDETGDDVKDLLNQLQYGGRFGDPTEVSQLITSGRLTIYRIESIPVRVFLKKTVSFEVENVDVLK